MRCDQLSVHCQTPPLDGLIRGTRAAHMSAGYCLKRTRTHALPSLRVPFRPPGVNREDVVDGRFFVCVLFPVLSFAGSIPL